MTTLSIDQILPSDPFHHILSFVAPKDLSACCLVSTAWNLLVSQDPPWTEAAKKIPWAAFAAKVFTRDPTQSMKQSLKVWHDRRLNSYTELLDRMQSFLNNMLIGQNGRFRCFAPGKKGLQKIVIKIKLTQDRISFSCDKDRIRFDVIKDFFFSVDMTGVKGEVPIMPRLHIEGLHIEGLKKKSHARRIQLIQNQIYFPFEGKMIVPILQRRKLFDKYLRRQIGRMISLKLYNPQPSWFPLEYLVPSVIITCLLDYIMYGNSPSSIERSITQAFLIVIIAGLFDAAHELKKFPGS